MPKSSVNASLSSYDDIFSTEESRQEEQREQVQQIPIGELFPFKNHPFKVLDDDSMSDTVESVKQYGVLSPLIARPRPKGGYEIISGHRRQHAAELAGLETLPVIVRQMDDDAAIILMVDSNLQREHILPSERAFAYKMKLDAMKNQGTRSDLRQKFSIISDEPLVLSSASGYQLNPELHIMTDYQRFDELVSSAVRASSVINKVDILKNALDLYRGRVLSSADGEHWLIQFATKYHLSYMSAVSELLKQLDSLRSYDLLNQYAMKSLAIAPDNPKAYCWLIRSLKAQGMNELATNELAAAKEHLTTEEYEEILAFGVNR